MASGTRKGEAPGLIDQIRRALRAKDIDALAAVYAAHAVIEEVSTLNPPSRPLVVEGRDAIAERLRDDLFHDPISGWARHLQAVEIVDHVETEDTLAFTEVRTYAAGDTVMAQHLARKRDGLIERDRVLVAWDAQ